MTGRVCEHCNKSLSEIDASRLARARFCGAACRRAAWQRQRDALGSEQASPAPVAGPVEDSTVPGLVGDARRPSAAGGEPETLAECERVIERGLAAFVAVGEALLRIREDRLYRESHRTFAEYCRERWGFTDRRARQLMGAAGVVAELPSGTTVPASEAVARELAPMRDEPERLREAWGQVVETHGPSPTAEQTRSVVGARPVTSTPRPERDAERAPPAAPEPGPPDCCVVPADLQAALRRGFRFAGKAEERGGAVCVGSRCGAGVAWFNPPAHAAARWVRAARDFASGPDCVAVCVVPVETTAAWWWNDCRHGEVRFLRSPLTWTQAGEEIEAAAAVVVFGRREAPSVGWWDPAAEPPAVDRATDRQGDDQKPRASQERTEPLPAADEEFARLLDKFPEFAP